MAGQGSPSLNKIQTLRQRTNVAWIEAGAVLALGEVNNGSSPNFAKTVRRSKMTETSVHNLSRPRKITWIETEGRLRVCVVLLKLAK